MVSKRSIGVMTIINAGGAIIAVLNSVVLAYYFGISDLVEAYFAAITLQGMLGGLTQTYELGEIFLPIYHQTKQERGIQAAFRAFGIILNLTLPLLALISIVLWYTAPLLMMLLVPGFSSEKLELAVGLFRWLLPLICIQGIIWLMQALANAERQFGKPEAIAVSARLLTLITIFSLVKTFGIWAVVIASWVGYCTQLLCLTVTIWRMGYSHYFGFRKDSFNIWLLYKKLLFSLVSLGSGQLFTIGLNAGLSMLPQGVYAVFKYVQQITNRTNSILLRPISIVFFTQVSEDIARKSKQIKAVVNAALRLTLAINTLACVGICVAGLPLVTGLWGGEHFGPKQLELAAGLLCFMYLLLYPTALAKIIQKLNISLGAVQHQYIAVSIKNVVFAIAAWMLIGPYGIPGLITVVGATVICACLVQLVVLRIWNSGMMVFYPMKSMVQWMVAGAGGLCIGTLTLWGAQGAFESWEKIGQLLTAAISGGMGMMVALVIAWLLRVGEVRSAGEKLTAMLGNRRVRLV